MKASNDLFDLIHSLSKNEKRYFKQFSSLHIIGHKQNKYVLLFDAIERQKKYDEQEIIQQLRGRGFLNHFAVAKNYLYNQVLYALESYHQSIHTEVRSWLHRIEILYDKGLYKQSIKAVNKTKKLARQNDMLLAVLEICKYWEFELANKGPDVEWMKKIKQEEDAEMILLQNTKTYKDLLVELFTQYQIHGTKRSQKYLDTIEKLINSPYLKDESKAKTFEAKIYFYTSHYMYARIQGNYMNIYKYARKVVLYYQAHPEKIKQSLMQYIGRLNNFLIGCASVKKYAEMPGCIEEMESLAPFTKNILQKAMLFHRVTYHRLIFLNETGQFHKAVGLLPVIKKRMMEFKSNFSGMEKTILYGNVAFSYFGARDYRNSIQWLNKIRNEVLTDIIPLDIQSYLRLFYLIAHYEAGNDELLRSLTQSVYRFLRQKERLYKFEILVLEFLRRMPGINSLPKKSLRDEGLISSFRQLHAGIKPLTKDKYEKNAFEYFDYMSWLESKMENRSFAEIIKEKAASRH